ncbi:uncharacterized protein LOC106674000 isoform X2 [Cimex lectularius]|uniref:USP domain-containing protein n=1 Tax=Cimex lectularius TaxID=79782 RepID=A0A8I6SCK2_CIMLE|nr:uncharacterized protein LOC106674000 isoform X2 [Cimex lectularius]
MKDRTRTRKALFQISKVLWHLDIFRRSFRELSGHTCMLDSCIFCALKELFSQLQFSHESALPPDALRRALAESFFDQQRFQLGFMDDAAECFENILLRIHFHLASEEAEDLCSARHCIPHVKFAMTLVEQSVCGACGATSEPLPFTQMVHYVSASALISQAKQVQSPSHPDLFGQLLKKAGGMGDIRDCPSACGAKIQIRRTLTNQPEIVSVGIIWDSDRPSLEHIMSLLLTLRTTLRLSDVFHTPPPLPNPTTNNHQLVGVVTYYGKHYSTFFFHTKLKIWIYFDDANVREVGPKWEQVVEKCRRGRYQPLLLLFAAPDGTPVDPSTAPTSITVAPRALGLGKPPIPNQAQQVPQQNGRRSLTPSPEKPSMAIGQQRRAVTPNPQQQQQQQAEAIKNRPAQQPVMSEYQNFMVMMQKPLSSPTRTNVGSWGPQSQAIRRGATELVRRDSGNWSGDRNSASSSSSTSLENPYQYIIGKMHNGRGQVVPRSPTSLKGGESSSGGSQCDPGYDSYSLSSTDSLPLQQTLKHNLQLAQIPEGHQSPVMIANMQTLQNGGHSECERLCEEADMLLKHSQTTDNLEMALSYANAAVGKARQAMDAPYSNPQSASAARMKHNTCIMQARSLHKKLEDPVGPRHAEGRHSREGSGCSGRGSTGSHSRQNSKDKGNHSRQNSRELLTTISTEQRPLEIPEKSPEKSIEIYATLPKTKKGLLSRAASKLKNSVEDEDLLSYDRPGRSLSRKPPNGKKDEKRARSEERNNKNQKEKEFISNQIAKDAKKQAKADEQKQNKKQHKVRRKLLMGGLIRRKNRSMPDLREDEVNTIKGVSKDDTSLVKMEKQGGLSGYLSEGHLEYSGNPNLERSKLMRKSLHSSKLIHMAKVPPPPPLRTTSQLSKNDRPPFPLPDNFHQNWQEEPHSLPPMSNYNAHTTDAITYANGGYLLNEQTKLVTTAQVHQVGSPVNEFKQEDDDFVLPPYPSPLNSVSHSRQASEDFPPPPNEIETLTPTTLLEQLQQKRQQILNDNGFKEAVDTVDYAKSSGGDWLRELQAKQAKFRDQTEQKQEQRPPPETQAKQHEDVKIDQSNSVKDLKSRFENINIKQPDKKETIERPKTGSPLTLPNPRASSVGENKNENEITKHEEIKSSLSSSRLDDSKRKSSKKKNVTFCEQVVLVATAEEDKVNSYIPNPILERVLRSVLHRDPPHQETKEIAVHSVVPLKRNDSGSYGQCAARTPTEVKEMFKDEIGTSVDSDEPSSPKCPPGSADKNEPFQNGTKNLQRMVPSPMPTRQVTRAQPMQIAHSHQNIYNGSPSPQTENQINPSPYQLVHQQHYQDDIRMGGSLPRDSYMIPKPCQDIDINRYNLQTINALKSELNQNREQENMNHSNDVYDGQIYSTSQMNHQMMQGQSNIYQGPPQSIYNQNYNVQQNTPSPLSITHAKNQSNMIQQINGPLSPNSQTSPYQTIPVSAHCAQYNNNGAQLAQSTNAQLMQSQQLRQQLTNGQMMNMQRNIPSPIVHNNMQNQMRQMNPQIGNQMPQYQMNQQNTQIYQMKNLNPAPATYHLEHQISPPVSNPQTRPYAHQLQQSYQQQMNQHGQTQIAYSHLSTTAANLQSNAHQNTLPSPSLSLKSQIMQQAQPCYTSLPQKMRQGQNGLLQQQNKTRPQTMYQHEAPTQDKKEGQQAQSVYQRVPNPMGHDYSQNQYPNGPLSPNYNQTTQGPYLPVPNLQQNQNHQNQQAKYSPYQHPPIPRQMEQNKQNNSAVRNLMCHLCRKKTLVPPAIYCTDCDFYMSRFKPRT